MPEYTGDEIQKDKRPCSGIKMDLIECLMNSDCVLKDQKRARHIGSNKDILKNVCTLHQNITLEKKSPKECLRSYNESVPQDCYSLKTLFFECKRSLLDNRTRFRGRKGY